MYKAEYGCSNSLSSFIFCINGLTSSRIYSLNDELNVYAES